MPMTDLPLTSRAAVLEEYGRPLRIREIPIPALEPGGILVRVAMAGICGTDVHQSKGTLTIRPPLPNLQGHETIGVIERLGNGRTHDVAGEPLAAGDRIMWAHADCGQCYWCQLTDDSVLCDRRQGYGFADPALLRGGFAEFEYVTPHTKIVKIPAELTNAETIGVGCAFRTAVAGFERLGGLAFQESVVILGAGPVGLYSTLLAVEGGAERVIVVGAPERRLQLARKWGATHTISIEEVPEPAARRELILSLTRGRGPETAVECSGIPSAFNDGLEMLQKGGRFLVMGQTSTTAVSVVPGVITSRALTVIGSVSATIRHFRRALQFIESRRGKYPFADIVTSRYRLDQINTALANMASGVEIKPVIDNELS